MTTQQFANLVVQQLRASGLGVAPRPVDRRDDWLPLISDDQQFRVVDPETGCAFMLKIEATA